MVIWIIGLSGSGKTTLGTEMFKMLKKSKDKWVFLDGDMVRAILGEDLGHTVEDRRKNANRISNLCKLLDSQGINVLACVLSIFHDNQENNRQNLSSYKEIFIDVNFDKLLERDNKKLYTEALKGNLKNVVGVDIDFSKPINSDIVIDNNKDQIDFTNLAYEIINKLGIKLSNEYEYSCINRLKHPHKYQYTDFEGTAFLEKYEESRKAAITSLKIRIADMIDNENKSVEYVELMNDITKITYFCKNGFSIDIDESVNKDEVITVEFLFNLLMQLDSNENPVSPKVFQSILLLIKRFEVSKKLYSKYLLDTFKKSSNEYDVILNYILFSNVLIKLYKIEEVTHRKYIMFNALLKINDLIISVLGRITTVGECLLAYNALKEELNIYQILRGEHLC